MKKKILIIILICLFAFAVPTVAKEKEPVGERINIFAGTPTTFPADTPFHINHGWIMWHPDIAIGLIDVDLEVDEEYREEDYIERYAEPYQGTSYLYRIWYFNFPEGLPAGEHTFVVHWLGSCLGGDGPPCSNPNELEEVFTLEHTVTFYP